MPAVAGTIRHDTDDAEYRAFGGWESLASVGAIIGETSEGYYGCSGTAISAHWMLTAAHCVDHAKNIDFYLRNQQGGYNACQGSSWLAHELFSGENLFAGWDIGLVYFDRPLEVKPAELYRGNSELGSLGVIAGFGSSGNGLGGVSSPFGVKRAGLNLISYAFSTEGDGEQLLFGDFDPPQDDNPFGAWDFFEDGYALPFEYSPAFGDSGGGMFIVEDDQLYLAGVSSFILDLNGNDIDADYGDGFAETRVSSLWGWINKNTASVPEPGSGLLAGLALVLLAWRRRFARG
jgi:hypothetical protein